MKNIRSVIERIFSLQVVNVLHGFFIFAGKIRARVTSEYVERRSHFGTLLLRALFTRAFFARNFFHYLQFFAEREPQF